MTRAVTDLEQRWNKAASASGYAGSEFHDEPESVFELVRSDRHKLHLLRIENVRLKREVARRSGCA